MKIPFIGGVLDSVIDGVTDIISEVIVDKDKRNQINLELERLRDRGNERLHQQILAIQAVNREEAKHGSVFVAGWRPAVGWVCAAGLAAQVIVLPLLDRIFGWSMPFDTELLLLTMSGMLGIGAMRTVEKVRGVSTNDYSDVPGRPQRAPEPILPPMYMASEVLKDALPEDVPWAN